METCESIVKYIGSVSLIRACDIVRDGSLRISTPFQYANGSFIDVFFEDAAPLLDEFELTDMGQTTAYLLDLQIKHWATSRRKTLVSEVCNGLGVMNDAGVLKIRFPTSQIKELPDYVFRLSQACIRVADLAFTHKFRATGVFFEDVEEFIAGTQADYDTGVKVPRRYVESAPVEFDFLVKGNRKKSLIQTVSSPSAAVHGISTEVFARWWDIDRSPYQCITVYDSEREYRPEDIQRLADVSETVGFPSQEGQLREMILA